MEIKQLRINHQKQDRDVFVDRNPTHLLDADSLDATGAKNQYFEQEWHLSVKRNKFPKVIKSET